VRAHLAIEERLDRLGERHAFGIAQLRVGLRVAVLVAANRAGLVSFAECCQNGLSNRSREFQTGALGRVVQHALERLPIFEEGASQTAHKLADRLCAAQPSANSFSAAGPFFFDCASA